jgi:hypothetical protein
MENLIPSGNKERVNFLFPKELVRKARRAASELDCTLSDFIREAVSSFIKEIELAKTKKELEEGYKANYSYYANLNKEWEIADSE